jgi:CHAT domain-containing protein
LGDRFAEWEWRKTQLPSVAREQLTTLVDRIQAFDERIAVSPDIVERVRLESERTLVVGERGRLERRLRDELRLGKPAFRPPTLDELRAHLAADTALITTVHSGEVWWALVICRDAPARFVLLADPDLGKNAAAWQRRLRGDPIRAWPLRGERLAVQLTKPDGAIGAYLTSEQLGQRLSRNLLEPLESALGAKRHLVFVGDDELVGIPLQALPRGAGFVLDRYEVSYAPSLTNFARWQNQAHPEKHARDLLAIGAVNYPRLAPPATDDPILVGAHFAGEHALPFARAELAGISALFPARRTTTWTGDRANTANLRRASQAGELSQYRYVHFATHAWAQPDQPESSAIALAGASEEFPSQGALTAAELAGLQMGADLLVLSACDTGLGHFEHGRGLLGLAYASLAAGNRAALLSLWPVADDTTADFMQHLYVNLRRGLSPPKALAATQREFLHSPNPRLSDPLVWAPFVLYGGY